MPYLESSRKSSNLTFLRKSQILWHAAAHFFSYPTHFFAENQNVRENVTKVIFLMHYK